jgi:hypothetical protein
VLNLGRRGAANDNAVVPREPLRQAEQAPETIRATGTDGWSPSPPQSVRDAPVDRPSAMAGGGQRIQNAQRRPSPNSYQALGRGGDGSRASGPANQRSPVESQRGSSDAARTTSRENPLTPAALEYLRSIADAEGYLTLYHGARVPLNGRPFSLSDAAAGRTETHRTSQEVGIFLTTDPLRAASSYGQAGINIGDVTRVRLPREYAERIGRLDESGRIEFVAFEEADVAALNWGRGQCLPSREAIRQWGGAIGGTREPSFPLPTR